VFSGTGERDASVKPRDPAERERGCSGLPPSPWNEMVFENLVAAGMKSKRNSVTLELGTVISKSLL